MSIDSTQFKGVVVSSKANYLNVDIDYSSSQYLPSFIDKSEPIRLLCTRRTKLKHFGLSVYVGDKVLVENIDWKSKQGVVSKVFSRESLINRPPVANVSNIVVLLSVSEPEFALDQASRFLIAAEKTGVEVTLVLTKVDLIPLHQLLELMSKLDSWFYEPISISTKNETGVKKLINKLESFNISVLCGPSGVGKTSLINYLLPEKSLLTAPVSRKLRRGRHTTRNVELFSLPNGSLIADTPGFNRPDLVIHPNQLQSLFPELRSQYLSSNCKFRDCLHRDEPGCSIDRNWQRYSFYREYLEEMIIHHHQSQGG